MMKFHSVKQFVFEESLGVESDENSAKFAATYCCVSVCSPSVAAVEYCAVVQLDYSVKCAEHTAECFEY